ncbi:hypothetical protein [Nostoc sp. ChiQUE01b]
MKVVNYPAKKQELIQHARK